MDQQGLSRKDLLPIFGTTARISEVLSGKRALTLDMIRKLHTVFGIPLDSLIAPTAHVPTKKRRTGGKAEEREGASIGEPLTQPNRT